MMKPHHKLTNHATKCATCYGRGHAAAACISVESAGMNQVRPKCRGCHGFGHAVEFCPSKPVAPLPAATTPVAPPVAQPAVQTPGLPSKCPRCNGRNHSATVCASPGDAHKNRLMPRCVTCEGWGHATAVCPLTAPPPPPPPPPPPAPVQAPPPPTATGADADDDSLRARYLWQLGHVMLAKDAKLSRFYVDRMTDVAAGADLAVQEERKYCAHCSTLMVNNVTAVTRSSTARVLQLPRRAPALPKGTMVRGSVVRRCLVCGERRREHGKLERRAASGAAATTHAAKPVKRKRRKSKNDSSLKAAAPLKRKPASANPFGTLDDFLLGL